MSSSRVLIEVLGPLRVVAATGEEVRLSGVLQRRLLAVLVLRRGSVVSPDSATEALWPTGLPNDPAAALQNHVSRLRQRLPAGIVESVGSGYRLDADRVEVDVDRLESLLADQPLVAAHELQRQLARWRGAAYADLDEYDPARVEAARLDELRQRGREAVAEARLAVGDLDGLVTEVATMVESDPLRERPRELLMSALAASGRTVEALRVFDDFRRLLGDELGIEPSPSLTAAHDALLLGEEPSSRRARSRSRLPIPPTALVGREGAVIELVELAGANRLVTLLGPGGVGKTRLLIELGSRLRAGVHGPVVWCDLTRTDAQSACDTVSAALGIDARRCVDPLDRIVEVVGDDDIVLLLDNCEHVLDPIAELVDGIVSGCPNVTVIATSRERLRAAGEKLFVVPPLSALTGDDPAVELFVKCAGAVSPEFSPDDDQLAEVVEIVRRLDGLPLAIELAAARLRSLELSELAAGLDRRFNVLSTGSRTSARHASLTAAVTWSFDSLDDELRRTFVALSMFSRPFTAADAAAVCGVDAAAVTELLSGLVERSLVQRAPGRRYVLLETLRAFGIEQLVGAGEADRVRERHARWMVDWVEQAEGALAVPGRPVLAEVNEAIPELRAVLSWVVDHGMANHAGRLVVRLRTFALLRVRPDVLAWADTALATDPGDMAPALLAAAAYATWMAGDIERASELVEHGFRRERELRGVSPVASLRAMRGNIDLFEGRLTDATWWYQQAIDTVAGNEVELTLNRATQLLSLGYAGDLRAVDLAERLLADLGDAATAPTAYAWYCAGEADLSFDLDRARARLVRAMELAEATGASFVLGVAGASKASIEARVGDPEVAMADYAWLIEHWRRAGMWATQWTMLRSVAVLLGRVGRYLDAAVLEGAVRGTSEGHRIFGSDAAALDELSSRLQEVLGEDAYGAARRRGAMLDGAAAVEHALRAL